MGYVIKAEGRGVRSAGLDIGLPISELADRTQSDASFQATCGRCGKPEFATPILAVIA